MALFSSADEPIHLYDILWTIDAFLLIAFYTTFYEWDSLPLQKHVLPAVDKNWNIDTYPLDTIHWLPLKLPTTQRQSSSNDNLRISYLIASRRIKHYMTAYPRKTMFEYQSILFLWYLRLWQESKYWHVRSQYVRSRYHSLTTLELPATWRQSSRDRPRHRLCRYACDPNAIRMRPNRNSNASRLTDRAVMPTIHRPNDSTDMPAILTWLRPRQRPYEFINDRLPPLLIRSSSSPPTVILFDWH